MTLAGRWGDRELAACRDKKEIKALLMTRHEKWKKENAQRIKAAGHPVQLSFWGLPETFLDLSQAYVSPGFKRCKRLVVVQPAAQSVVS